jgi:hypothetical protein
MRPNAIPTVYGVGRIGLGWVCYKMDSTCPSEPELVYDWTANIISAQSCEMMEQLATMIHAMTGTSHP